MRDNFSQNKSHEENVKVSVNKILGTPIALKRIRKKTSDQKKNFFVSFIDLMIKTDIREAELHHTFNMDMYSYDSTFYQTIETLLLLHFSKKQVELIYFYLYERITPEGHMCELVDDTGKPLDMSTPEKLWDLLQQM